MSKSKSVAMAALAAYSDMLADPDVPSAKLAELAGVDVAEVERERGTPAVEPEPEPSAAQPKAEPAMETRPWQAAPPPAPLSVRAVKKRLIRGPTGRTLLVKAFDVFNGELAAWLWVHHPELVKPLES